MVLKCKCTEDWIIRNGNLFRELLRDYRKTCGQEARVADSLYWPDDKAEADEGRAILDVVEKTKKDWAKTGEKNPGVENSKNG